MADRRGRRAQDHPTTKTKCTGTLILQYSKFFATFGAIFGSLHGNGGGLENALTKRYAGWQTVEAIAMLDSDLGAICDRVLTKDINPTPLSGRQEVLENYVNRFL